MNSHEQERIAAAMNQLRPDWPTRQLKTLLADPRITERPRRDVTVALAWVACESGTSNPYRVLEAGPWWRAAAIEGNAAHREIVPPEERCGICGKSRARCESAPRFGAGDLHDDHAFAPDFKTKRGADVIEIVDALKAELTPMREPKSATDRKTAHNPAADGARAALHAEPNQGDRMTETEREAR